MEQLRNLIHWLRAEGRALVLVIGLVVLFGGVGWFTTASTRGARTPEIGTIVRFGGYSDRYGSRPAVIVRMADGSIHQLWAPPWKLRFCQVGDPIYLERRGSALLVGIDGCGAVTGQTD